MSTKDRKWSSSSLVIHPPEMSTPASMLNCGLCVKPVLSSWRTPRAAPKGTSSANGHIDTFYAGSQGGCLEQVTQKRKREVLQTPKPEPSITFGKGWALRP